MFLKCEGYLNVKVIFGLDEYVLLYFFLWMDILIVSFVVFILIWVFVSIVMVFIFKIVEYIYVGDEVDFFIIKFIFWFFFFCLNSLLLFFGFC